jgi:hypothetical protein
MKKHPMKQLHRVIRKQQEFIDVFGNLHPESRIPCAEVHSTAVSSVFQSLTSLRDR